MHINAKATNIHNSEHVMILTQLGAAKLSAVTTERLLIQHRKQTEGCFFFPPVVSRNDPLLIKSPPHTVPAPRQRKDRVGMSAVFTVMMRYRKLKELVASACASVSLSSGKLRANTQRTANIFRVSVNATQTLFRSQQLID